MDTDRSLYWLAARSIRRQVRRLQGQLEGIRAAEDIEYVHQARVASRRLRTALRVFRAELGEAGARPWRKAIRRTARKLGEARDKDVQIAYARQMLLNTRDPRQVSGIARVLAAWEQERESLQPRIVRSLEELVASGVLGEMLATCKRLGKRCSSPWEPGPAVFDHARRNILSRWEQLWALRTCLGDPDDYAQHHRMRIAAKHLRYTMEIYRPAYAGRLDAGLDVMKQIQAYLGDLHDCDVWMADLDRLAGKEARRIVRRFGHAGPMASLEPGIRFLWEERAARRRQWFQALAYYWRGLTEQGFWEEFIEAVQGPVASPLHIVAAKE